MRHEGLKVSVTMEQRQITLDAECGDDRVDRLSGCYAERAEPSKILRGHHRNVAAREIKNGEGAHQIQARTPGV